jgi:prepilin-type N-terminal cleavage/methylation domain-containing protein
MSAREEGFTIVEMLVSMALFAVLGSVLLGFALGTSGVVDDVRADSNVTGEARVAVERMARELRQAEEVRDVTIVDGQIRSFTLEIDFDGQAGSFVSPVPSGSASPSSTPAYDSEVLTYSWRPDEGTLTMSDGGTTADVLTGGVVSVLFDLRSSAWIHDKDHDGTTTWDEIDQPAGAAGHQQLDADELALIDLVSIEIVVEDGDTTRRFVVQTDMRNRDGQDA